MPNIWRPERVSDSKFGANVTIKMLMNATKYEGCSFYSFLVIKGKSIGEDKPPPSQIRVKMEKARLHKHLTNQHMLGYVSKICRFKQSVNVRIPLGLN